MPALNVTIHLKLMNPFDGKLVTNTCRQYYVGIVLPYFAFNNILAVTLNALIVNRCLILAVQNIMIYILNNLGQYMKKRVSLSCSYISNPLHSF